MKKTGKKLAASALALTMVLSLAACGGKKTEAPADTTTATTTATTAAIQAVQDGATDVIVLEKMPITGGNTTRSTGGLNAAATTYQTADGIEDSVELFVEDTMKGGKELNNKELVTVMAEKSAGAVDWVNEIGGDLSVVGMFGGASVKRIHRPSDTSAVGPMLVKTLNAKMEELGIPVLLETTATKILVDEKGAVCGVTATDNEGKELTINCTTVVLASGGFGANAEMVVEYKADLAGFATTNHAGATGDGIAMAQADGAALCAPAVHHTMGGVVINTATEVLKEDGTAIAGLFAAGEVTGGVHGANRLGGNAVTDIVVFGRIAGTASAGYVAANGGNTEQEIDVEEEAAATPEVQGGYKDGVYEGTGKGNNGDIKVEVTVTGGNITSVVLKEHGETEGIFEAAEKNVTEDIIKMQTPEVDAVSSATNTSNGIMEAVTNALSTAK